MLTTPFVSNMSNMSKMRFYAQNAEKRLMLLIFPLHEYVSKLSKMRFYASNEGATAYK